MDKPIRPIILIIGVNVLMFGYMAALALYAYIDGAPESLPPTDVPCRHKEPRKTALKAAAGHFFVKPDGTVIVTGSTQVYTLPAGTNTLLIRGREAQ